MGICYGDQGRMGKAMGKFIEAKAAFEDDGATQTAGYAKLLVQIGIWYGMQEQKLEEMEKYKEAQKVYRRAAIGGREYAGLLKNMGIWFMEQQQMPEAMEKFQEAQSQYISSEATKSTNYAGLLTSMGKWLLQSGLREDAMEKFQAAKVIYEATDEAPMGYAGLLMMMGGLHRSHEDSKAARDCFEKAQGVFESAGGTMTTEYLGLLAQMASCAYEQGNYTAALKKYTEAQTAYQAHVHVSRVLGSLRRLAGWTPRAMPGCCKALLDPGKMLFVKHCKARPSGGVQQDGLA